MAEPHNPGGALADGAARLEQVARQVKDGQRAHTKAGLQPLETEPFVLSPDEDWARKYTTHCVGPVCFGPPADLPAFSEFSAAPAPNVQSHGYAAKTAPSAREKQVVPAQSGPIGVMIGKPARPRTWLGRLLHGK